MSEVQPRLPDYLPGPVLAWATTYREILERVVEEFLSVGEWPETARLGRELAREEPAFSLSEMIATLPRELGFVEGQPRVVVLLLFGLRLTHAGQRLLEDFFGVLTTAVERFRGSEEVPSITRADISKTLDLTDAYARALSTVVLREAAFLGSGSGGPDENWIREITEDITRYMSAGSIDDYLQIRARESRLNPEPVSPEAGSGGASEPSSPSRPPLQPNASVSARPTGDLATVLSDGVHHRGVTAIAIATVRGRSCAVTGDGIGTVRMVDLVDPEASIGPESLASAGVSAIALGTVDDVAVAAAAGDDGMVRLLSLADATLIDTMQLPEGSANCIAIAPLQIRSGLFVAGGRDGTITAWDIATGDNAIAIPGHTGPVLSLTTAQLDERLVVISGGEDGVRFWDLTSGAQLHAPRRSDTGAVNALVAGRLKERPVVVSGGSDGTLRLWELADGGPMGEPLEGHSGPVVSLAVVQAEDRPIVASGGADGTVRVWDMFNRRQIDSYHGHDGAVQAVAAVARSDRLTIISGGVDMVLRMWEPSVTSTAGSGVDQIEWLSDARAAVDLLQRRPLAQALATRLERLRAAEPDRSFLIHVDGRWGSGKSTLLGLLGEELRDGWLIVEFDAWRQVRVGPPWWALLASLRQAIVSDLNSTDRTKLRIAEAWKRLRSGGALYASVLGVLLAIVVALALLFHAGLGLGTTSKVAGTTVAVGASLGVLYASMSAVGRFLLWGSAAGARVFEQSHRDPMESIADHFAWLSGRAPRPVLFFVDDLDRCSHEYVVDFLDSVQTLVRDATARHDGRPPGHACYIIVAADGRWIRTAYEHAHADFADVVGEPGRPLGYMFLDKIFQLTVPVPSMSPQRQTAYLKALLGVQTESDVGVLAARVSDVQARLARSATEAEALDAFEEASPSVRALVAEDVVSKLAEPQIEKATEHRFQRFTELMEANPRAMKLTLNAYGIARAIQVLEDNVVSSDALALWTILRIRWPALADYVATDPEAVEALATGGSPSNAPAELTPLFVATDVKRIVSWGGGESLTPAMIRACCGARHDEVM